MAKYSDWSHQQLLKKLMDQIAADSDPKNSKLLKELKKREKQSKDKRTKLFGS